MGIWITGDFHGDPYRLHEESFYEQKTFGPDKNDNVLLQLGDFGIVWNQEETRIERYKLKWLEEKNFTIAFIDGNHDNIPRLDRYPIKEWCGGLVNEIRPNVLRLRRGEVYTIQGKKFFAFGGASSHDIKDGIIDPADYTSEKELEKVCKEWNDAGKWFRVKNISWWEEELPSMEEMANGIKNLLKNNMMVDYILSHTPPSSVLEILGEGAYVQDRLTIYLEEIRSRVRFKKHYMGHMHVNYELSDKDMLLYEQIEEVV